MVPTAGVIQVSWPVFTLRDSTSLAFHGLPSCKVVGSTSWGGAFRRRGRRSGGGVKVIAGKEVLKKEEARISNPNLSSQDRSVPAILNRLAFELVPALPIAPWERPRQVYDDIVYNFAFGSNLKRDVLDTRGGGIQVISAEPGKVLGYRLSFPVAAAASIAPEKGAVVHGVLLKMPRKEYDILYKTEGATSGPFRPYWEELVTVETYAGKKVQAVAFRVSPLYRLTMTKEAIPNKRYINLIRAGARELNLNSEYVEWLDNLPEE